jgi:hypothetical protein
MTVANDGWAGQQISPADAMFEQAFTGQRRLSNGGTPITEGPLADFNPGIDPVKEAARMRRESVSAMAAKTGSVTADSSFAPRETKIALVSDGSSQSDTTSGPGQDRAIQGRAEMWPVDQTVNDAKVPPPAVPKTIDKGPTTGALGKKLLDRVRAVKATTKSIASDPTGSKSMPDVTADNGPGALPDSRDKSSWTGSGPTGALSADYSKVGEAMLPGFAPTIEEIAPIIGDPVPAPELPKIAQTIEELAPITTAEPEDAPEDLGFTDVSDEAARGLLKLAGVPDRQMATSGMLWNLAKHASVKVASDPADLNRDDIHPLKLAAVLEDDLGAEWREWEPETIKQSLETLAGHDIGEPVMTKVMALQLLYRRPDVFYGNWQAMEKISVALNDIAPTMGVIEDVEPEWLSNAVAIAGHVAPGDFSDDVSSYVAARLADHGYVLAPPLLRFADAKLGSVVNDDALRRRVLVSYSQHVGDEDPPADEDPVSIQVARLMGHHAYVLDRFDQAREQVEG